MQAALRIAATALFISALFGAPAFAQEKGHRLAACKADIDKLCASEPRGHGRIRPALKRTRISLRLSAKPRLKRQVRERPNKTFRSKRRAKLYEVLIRIGGAAARIYMHCRAH